MRGPEDVVNRARDGADLDQVVVAARAVVEDLQRMRRGEEGGHAQHRFPSERLLDGVYVSEMLFDVRGRAAHDRCVPLSQAARCRVLHVERSACCDVAVAL